MKKIFALLLAGSITVLFSVSAHAVGPGKKVEFDGKGAGKVVFDGKTHGASKCGECHKPGLFKTKKGGDSMTMKDMAAGKFCGACHNGVKAFGVKEASTCAKCHKKK